MIGVFVFAYTNVRISARLWRDDPVRGIAQLGVSAFIGQGVFWKFGSDQIGVGMNPVWTTGLGPRIGKALGKYIPCTPAAAWSVKGAEIGTDFMRAFTEGHVYNRWGITPDVVCTAVTPELWPTIEALEKLTSALLYPDLVVTKEQLEQSIANIYGNVFRFGQAGIIVLLGPQIDKYMTRPLERVLHKILPW